MTAGRLRDNSIKGLMLFSLFIAMSIKSCVVNAQSSRELRDVQIRSRVQAWEDSVRKSTPSKHPMYLGGEITMAFPQYQLRSHINQLDGLKVSYIGSTVGGVLANDIGKLKANGGLFYSEPTVPYSMTMLQGAVSASVYVLRLKEVKFRTFEPYVLAGLAYQQTKYYGTYLFTPEQTASYNFSTTEAPLMGRTGFTQMNVGGGVEYQLESCQNLFIHLFAECRYGIPVSGQASNASFAGTKALNPMTFSVGINFGICK